jgi:hypothetical protein
VVYLIPLSKLPAVRSQGSKLAVVDMSGIEAIIAITLTIPPQFQLCSG